MPQDTPRGCAPLAEQIAPRVWRFLDSCAVYVVRTEAGAIAFDFGSGRWLARAREAGLSRLDHVLLTHHHADQCAGLEARRRRAFAVHAPAGEERFLDPARLRAYAESVRALEYVPFPASYEPLARGIEDVLYDVRPYGELYLNGLCVRAVPTPGHGPNAVSYLVEVDGRTFCFCGDAVHAGGTVWRPYTLEWDHWTGQGALAAWEGVKRLEGIGFDSLCPGHGPGIHAAPRAVLRRLGRRLLDLYRAKGSVCAGERDRFIVPEPVLPGVMRLLPHLYRGPSNAYLLHAGRQALLVDPTRQDLEAFLRLLAGPLRGVRLSAATVTHAHWDHYQGAALARRRTGARLWLHPRLKQALTDARARRGLYRGLATVRVDGVWPERGAWNWNGLRFRVAPWPGQTWWHCAFMTEVDGRRVLFGGDSFQPASRWNGTGGFCALNGCRFREGFTASARLALRWRPDWLACGHRTTFEFSASRFRRILRWAASAERAVRALCPSGQLALDYYNCPPAGALRPGPARTRGGGP